MTANQILLHSKNESTKEISLSRKDVCELYHLDAHEVLFLDVMEGDDRFFLSDREIELAW
jgi:glucose-6-phosphate 1-dehydrogenase